MKPTNGPRPYNRLMFYLKICHMCPKLVISGGAVTAAPRHLRGIIELYLDEGKLNFKSIFNIALGNSFPENQLRYCVERYFFKINFVLA